MIVWNERPTSPSWETTPPISNALPATPTPKGKEWRKVAAQLVGIIVVLGAAVLTLWVWNITERHPRTDDATARANVVGIAPRVRGQISKPNLPDKQAVAPGARLFEIETGGYRISLEK